MSDLNTKPASSEKKSKGSITADELLKFLLSAKRYERLLKAHSILKPSAPPANDKSATSTPVKKGTSKAKAATTPNKKRKIAEAEDVQDEKEDEERKTPVKEMKGEEAVVKDEEEEEGGGG
ncbi:MAG: hypothetical protein Q9219_007551 [cf. Caloplaca sp. 3 TL-2023]